MCQLYSNIPQNIFHLNTRNLLINTLKAETFYFFASSSFERLKVTEDYVLYDTTPKQIYAIN